MARPDGHLRIGLPGAVVFEIAHKRIIGPRKLCAGSQIHEGLKAQAVSKLVQDDGDEVDLDAQRLLVQAVIPGKQKRAGGTDRAIEYCNDVVAARIEVGLRELVCQGG